MRRDPRSPNRARAQRGATLVEYAFLIALVAMAAIIALSELSRVATERFFDAADDFGEEPPPVAPGDGGDDAGGGGGGATTSTTAATTSTTAAAPPTTSTPTTAPTTTTTTTAPPSTTTTTTAPPPTTTTTTAPALQASVTSAGSSTWNQWWDPTGRRGAWVASLTIRSNYPQQAYLTIEATTVAADGAVSTTILPEVFVNAGGQANADVFDNGYGAVAANQNIVSVKYRVVQVRTYTADWQPITHATTGPTFTVNAPAPPG